MKSFKSLILCTLTALSLTPAIAHGESTGLQKEDSSLTRRYKIAGYAALTGITGLATAYLGCWSISYWFNFASDKRHPGLGRELSESPLALPLVLVPLATACLTYFSFKKTKAAVSSNQKRTDKPVPTC
jgi:hypothetical protein